MIPTDRSQAIRIGRYLLGLGTLIWVINHGDWSETVEVLSTISAAALLLVAVLAAGGVALRALTWYSIVEYTADINLRTAIEIDLMINFLNQLLPSRLSGRSAAPLVVRQRTGVNVGTAAGIAGVNTGLYALLYSGIALLGAGFIAKELSFGLLGLILIATVLYLIAGGLVLITGLKVELIDSLVLQLAPLARPLPILGDKVASLLDQVPEFTGHSAEVFSETLTSPRALGVFAVGWVGSIAIFPALRVYVLFSALGSSFEPLVMLPAILMAAYSVTILPLTPGGIGVTEATATFVFVALGVPYEVAASSVLVDRVIGVYLPALIGWYPLVRENPLTLAAD